MATFSVRVVEFLDGDEVPVRYKTVMLSLTSILRGWLESDTDGDGVAEFDADEGEAGVYFGGSKIDTFYFSDGDQYTINVTDV